MNKILKNELVPIKGKTNSSNDNVLLKERKNGNKRYLYKIK